MNKKRFLSSGLLEQYVLGLTSKEENQEVEKYLNAYPELQSEVDAMRMALEQYAMQQSVPPPGHLKSKILSDIDEIEANRKKSSSSGGVSRWLFSAAIIAALGFAALTTLLYKQYLRVDRDYRQLQANFAILNEHCEESQQESKEVQKLYAFLKHNRTLSVRLKGTGMAPEASAVVYWNEESKSAYFNGLHLPPPPEDKQYQIWADVEGEMISIGLLDYHPGELQQIDFIEEAESLNITLEPKGGSAKPTVERLYASGKV